MRVGSAVDDLEILILVGSSQWGLVTASQAQEAGVARMRLSRLVDRGTLQRVRHGVYALPSASGGPLQELRAAWLATDSLPAGSKPTAVVSGQSAAAVHGLGDLLPPAYEFSTPVRRQTTLKDIRYRTRGLSDADVTMVDGLPVTTVPRTVADLAAIGTDQEHLTAVVRDALAAGTSPSTLAIALELGTPPSSSARVDGQSRMVALRSLLEGHAQPAPDDATLRLLSDTMLQAQASHVQQSALAMFDQLIRMHGLERTALTPGLTAQMHPPLDPSTDAQHVVRGRKGRP